MGTASDSLKLLVRSAHGAPHPKQWPIRSRGEVTVVIIAHRLLTVKKADRVYVLDEGQVIEEGSYDELRHREEGVFREMVEMQSL